MLLLQEEQINNILESTINHLGAAEPVKEGEKVCYPGQRTAQTRADNNKNGVVADEAVWNDVCNL